MSASLVTARMSSLTEPADLAIDISRSDAIAPGKLSTISRELRRRNGHAVDPHTDGLAYLEVEHDSISDAMAVIIEKATAWCDRQEGSPEEVDTLVSRMVALVAQHASIEERLVYPLFGEYFKGEVEGVSASMIYERNVVDDNINKTVLDFLMQTKLRKDGRLMLATLKKFETIEGEHLMQEEHWFALLRRQLSAAQLKDLADNLRAASKTAVTMPHSVVGPSHGLAASLTHPVAAVIDHVMDKVTGRDAKLDVAPDGTKSAHGVPETKL